MVWMILCSESGSDSMIGVSVYGSRLVYILMPLVVWYIVASHLVACCSSLQPITKRLPLPPVRTIHDVLALMYAAIVAKMFID